MNVAGAEKYILENLIGNYDESESRNIGALLLEEYTGLTHTQLRFQRETSLTTEQEQKLHAAIKRLQRHEPVQYVLNKAWFSGMKLYVDKAVLVPRPETEELVDWILADVKMSAKNVFEDNKGQADATTQLKILDIGTGSGCIALALKKAAPKAEVWGCDLSEEALNVARRNGASLNIRVDFQGINFLDEAQRSFLPTVDIIVSNPPYVPLKDKEAMRPNVVAYEPHTALFVPNEDALLFYKAIAQFGKKRLYKNGALYVEIHESLGPDVANLFSKEGFQEVIVKKDMQGKERMVKAYALRTSAEEFD